MLTKAEIKTMDPNEEVELAWVLWEDAHEKFKAMPLSDEQKKMLDERLAYSLEHPESLRPWEEVMAELEAKYTNA